MIYSTYSRFVRGGSERLLSEVVRAGARKKVPTPKETDFVAIPFLPVHAGTPGVGGDLASDLEQVQPDSMWAAPVDWCPKSECHGLFSSQRQFDGANDPGRQHYCR